MDKVRAGAHYDVVVIGAGVTGAGVALDAVTRGLSVLLVDRRDLAFGTSRWSSKLAHGGLRYLASGNVGIARRSARERGILMEVTAPHLSHPLAQVVPVMTRFSWANRILPRLGFLAGDALRMLAGTSSRTLPRSRTVRAREVARLCPGVDVSQVKWGYVNFDGQLSDDATLVTAIARTAAGYGADVLTYAEATRQASGSGQRQQVSLGVREFGGDSEALDVSAGIVVNATGVWAGTLEPEISVQPSRGTHVVVDAAAVGNPTGALTIPVPGAMNRFCFILPAPLGRCYIGLTDNPAELTDEPIAPEEDIEWILSVVNQALNKHLTREDVKGSFAGLRPLISAGQAGESSTADLSREHAILRSQGMLTVTGGKLTEYRLMAEQTVDAVLEELPLAGEARQYGPCVTSQLPLLGAPDRPDSVETATCLVDNPEEYIAPGIPITRAQLSFAVTHQGALTESDLLDRRFRVGLVPEDRAAAKPAARDVLEAAGLA